MKMSEPHMGIAYAAVRNYKDFGEMLDTDTTRFLSVWVARDIANYVFKNPEWASENPVVRIAKVRVTEIPR